jgi:hypothetical protein
MAQTPDLWHGSDYQPVPMLKTRLYVIACIFIATAVGIVYLGARMVVRARSEGEALVTGLPGSEGFWWAVVAFFVVVAAPLLILIALLLIRWAETAYLRLAPEGVAYSEPSGTVWTDWENVERIEQVRMAFTIVGGLRLRAPAQSARPRGGRFLAWLQPLFVPSAGILGERFIPLTTLGVDLRAEAPLPQDLRRRAPWLFEGKQSGKM